MCHPYVIEYSLYSMNNLIKLATKSYWLFLFADHNSLLILYIIHTFYYGNRLMKKIYIAILALILFSSNAFADSNIWLNSNHKNITPNAVIKNNQIWLSNNHTQAPNFIIFHQINQNKITQALSNNQGIIVIQNNKIWVNEISSQPPFAILKNNNQIWLQDNHGTVANAIIKSDGTLWLSTNTSSIADAYIGGSNQQQDGLIAAALILSKQL